jgi:hypothetical protein
MSRNSLKSVIAAGALILAAALPARAEVSVRECITDGAPAGFSYSLPADGQWHDIGSLEFNHNSGSDYVISAVADLKPGNLVNAWVEYQITVDGLQYGWFTRRTPEIYATTQLVRAVAPDLPAGIHTIALRARNFSSSAVLYNRIWISPLLVDSSETTLKNYGAGGSVTVGSSWTNLAQLSIAVPSSKMLYLAGFATVTSGSPLTPVVYRLTSAQVVDTFNDSVPDVVSDGVHVASIYKPPSTGSANYWFQAKSLGAPFVVGARELAVQTLPAFTLLEGAGGAISLPNDFQWHTIAESPWITLPAPARGAYGSDGSGYAYYTYTGSPTLAEVRLDLETTYTPPADHWEVGWLGVNPSGYTKLEADASDWEQLGLDVGTNFRMHLQARGLCPSSPRPVSVSKSRFQVMILPDNSPFTSASCAGNPAVCCANNPSVCQKYECKMLLGLQPGGAAGSCP